MAPNMCLSYLGKTVFLENWSFSYLYEMTNFLKAQFCLGSEKKSDKQYAWWLQEFARARAHTHTYYFILFLQTKLALRSSSAL